MNVVFHDSTCFVISTIFLTNCVIGLDAFLSSKTLTIAGVRIALFCNEVWCIRYTNVCVWTTYCNDCCFVKQKESFMTHNFSYSRNIFLNRKPATLFANKKTFSVVFSGRELSASSWSARASRQTDRQTDGRGVRTNTNQPPSWK